MKRNLIPAFILFAIFTSFIVNGQKLDGIKQILSADSLASGNYKDVLTSFFNITLDKLSGADKEIKLTSNLFALMLKQNPSLNIDTNYIKYTFARNTNFGITAKLDTNKKFAGFSGTLKYAIINKRDYTIAKEFIPLVQDKLNNYFKLHNQIELELNKIDLESRGKFRREINGFIRDSIKFSDLDFIAKEIVLRSAKSLNLYDIIKLLQKDPNNSIAKMAQSGFEDIVKLYQNKPLWTTAFDISSYSDKFQVSSLKFTTEFLKGIMNPDATSNLEIDIKANLDIGDDSTKSGRDLSRSIFSFEAGLNWVIKNWNRNQTFLEFKFTAAENSITKGVYQGESKNMFTLNGTLRIRISNDVWVPIEFKYEPKTGNVFGLLNVTTNFSWLGIRAH